MRSSRRPGRTNQTLANASFGLRGERHHPDIWKALLPSAQKKLIEAGLFTPDGKITKLGLETLKDME